MKARFSSILLGLTLIFLASCNTQKNVNYLTYYPQDSSYTYIYSSYEVPIQVGDQLNIVVSALKPESALIYNLPAGTKGITVEQDGRILYPQLGLIKAEGLTRSQLRDVLLTRLRTYLTDPVVSVEFLNFKITVLGEVGRPGAIQLPEGKINILEAIAQAGDLTQYGKKYPVRIIRENKGRREFGYINLMSNSLFSSPYYRLQQNDIIYVEATDNKPVVTSQNFQQKLSLGLTVLSALTSIAFLVFTVLR